MVIKVLRNAMGHCVKFKKKETEMCDVGGCQISRKLRCVTFQRQSLILTPTQRTTPNLLRFFLTH